MLSWAGLGHFWKNTGMAVYHNNFSGSLPDSRYKKKKKNSSHLVKHPSFPTAATFSAKVAKEHILSVGKSDLYDYYLSYLGTSV